MTEVMLILLPLALCFWIAYLEHKVRELEEQRDIFGSTLMGIAQGKFVIKMERGKARVSVVTETENIQ
jgi:hypothetical protein